ncbi:YbaK/EbsC family protein [Maribius pontilimi]|uniref:YbaK/EbsC family protein n=1 Tax=Palleronia pontilimi TaxID=1964209 RepID=A0A934IEM9_9RHOB|nr:YbaK/EbsC family protein [Palleronia pontilimi]MBJ3761757.1 YbaK/EbsC family protein [Palleronia pontilimi]
MSKSLKRVLAALDAAGLQITPVEADAPTKTAAEAARALGVETDQIGKSIIFRGAESGRALLFLTAGGNRVDAHSAARLAGEPLERANAAHIRARTGFAIGGVSPVGHTGDTPAWMDRRLLDFDVIWCAAGTPRHNFGIAPRDLSEKFGLQVADFACLSGKM